MPYARFKYPFEKPCKILCTISCMINHPSQSASCTFEIRTQSRYRLERIFQHEFPERDCDGFCQQCSIHYAFLSSGFSLFAFQSWSYPSDWYHFPFPFPFPFFVFPFSPFTSPLYSCPLHQSPFPFPLPRP